MTQAFPADMSVGLVPMAAKPMHQGHYMLIEKASRENDHVIVYASTSDRKRTGEIPISGKVMHEMWIRYLEDIMPDNVEIEYGGSPIFKVYQQIGSENERYVAGDRDVASYVIYSDDKDMNKNFPDNKLEKYVDAMWQDGLIRKRPTPRATTIDISGTEMRSMLSSGDMDEFMKMLPHPLGVGARREIWKMLSDS